MNLINNIKHLSLALSATLALTGFSSAVMAGNSNPFGMSDFTPAMQVAGKDGKCGDGKAKATKAKCGAGKCGGNKAKASKSKSSEGKCGGSKAKPSASKCGGK